MNQITKDDFSMVTEADINEAVAVESNSEEFHKLIARLEVTEPKMSAWMAGTRSYDIAVAANMFDNLYSIYPSLPVFLNNLLLRTFLRGFQVSEAKWKKNLLKGIDMKGLGDAGSYTPKMEDFV